MKKFKRLKDLEKVIKIERVFSFTAVYDNFIDIDDSNLKILNRLNHLLSVDKIVTKAFDNSSTF